MLTKEQGFEIEVKIEELHDLNEVLTVNLETYCEMQAKGFGCVQICNLMEEKIEYIRSMF